MKKMSLIILLILSFWGLAACQSEPKTLKKLNKMNELLMNHDCLYIDDVLNCFKGYYQENDFINEKEQYAYIWDSSENSMLLMNFDSEVIYPLEREGDYLSGNRYVCLIQTEEELLVLKNYMFTVALGSDYNQDITFFFACSFDANHHNFTGTLYYSELASGDAYVRGDIKAINASKNLNITYYNYSH